MIAEENLRQLMEAEGYSPEEIDETCARYSQNLQKMQEAAKEWVEMMERIAQAFASTKEICEELLELATMPPPPKKEAPRPPRYAGPQNKGRSWTRQPPRLARSSCRKYRR